MSIDIYARVSQKKRNDERERSPEGQVAACRAVLVERGLTEGKVWIDPGRSAWNPKVTRPGWDALMARLALGETDGLIVFDLERFSRQPEDGERLIKLAVGGLMVLDSESEYDLISANGKKAFRDAMNAAAYYSDRLSSRIRRGMSMKARSGELVHSSRPFGFLDAGHKPGDPPPGHHPAEAPVLRELVTRLLAGETQDALIRDLNARGITTGTGGPWTRPGLRQMLLRPVNAGLVAHRGQIVATLPGEPLIPRQDYDRLVALFAARRRGRPASPIYLCSGIAVCGHCGRNLHGRPRPELKPYPDGEVRRAYWCGPYSSGGCARISIDQRGLDEYARKLAIEILSDPRHAAQIEAQAAETGSERARLDAEISEAEGLARALGDRAGRGEIDLILVEAAAGPLSRRLAHLRDERAALAQPPAPVPAERSREQWEQRWEAADSAERRNLLRQAFRTSVLVVDPADMSDRTGVCNRVRVR
jgi:DNA invertase Pin-like site-specific DNA recombinase